MRDGLDAPTETVQAAELERLRAYLDRQRPIALAVWVRHAHAAGDGATDWDHHTMLGMDEAAYARADLAALDRGLWEECPAPGWLDAFPLAEVEPLRAFGEVLWEREEEPTAGLDPLDFSLAVEAVEPPAGVGEAIESAVRRMGSVRRVDLARVSLRKSGCELEGWLRFGVVEEERGRRPGLWSPAPAGGAAGVDAAPNGVTCVSGALRRLDLGRLEVVGVSRPGDGDASTIVYERPPEAAA